MPTRLGSMMFSPGVVPAIHSICCCASTTSAQHFWPECEYVERRAHGSTLFDRIHWCVDSSAAFDHLLWKKRDWKKSFGDDFETVFYLVFGNVDNNVLARKLLWRLEVLLASLPKKLAWTSFLWVESLGRRTVESLERHVRSEVLLAAGSVHTVGCGRLDVSPSQETSVSKRWDATADHVVVVFI